MLLLFIVSCDHNEKSGINKIEIVSCNELETELVFHLGEREQSVFEKLRKNQMPYARFDNSKLLVLERSELTNGVHFETSEVLVDIFFSENGQTELIIVEIFRKNSCKNLSKFKSINKSILSDDYQEFGYSSQVYVLRR
jgi:hypothetical protein